MEIQNDNGILCPSVDSLSDIVKSMRKYMDKTDETFKFILAKMDELDKRLKRVEDDVERLTRFDLLHKIG